MHTMFVVALIVYLLHGARLAYIVAWRGAFDEGLRATIRAGGGHTVRGDHSWLFGIVLLLFWPFMYLRVSDPLYGFFFEVPDDQG